MKKAVQALGSIDDEAAVYALGRLFRLEELDGAVRRAALAAVGRHRSSVAVKMLQEFAGSWGPFRDEARLELERRNAQSKK